jgi:hypothetical protein
MQNPEFLRNTSVRCRAIRGQFSRLEAQTFTIRCKVHSGGLE